jgi:PAS domain S-box-containing protein
MLPREKERENELKRLALVASANDNGVAFCDGTGVINWANEGLCRLTGYSKEEILGSKAVQLCIGPLSDMDTIRRMLNAFYAGKGFNIEAVHYRKDGSWFWGRLKGQSIRDEKGKVEQYFAMIEDITLEKEQEEQLRVLSLIAEDNINAVIILDVAGCITWVNKSFTKLTGYSLEEAIGKTPGMMNGPDSNKQTIAWVSKQMDAGKPFNCELLNYTKNGDKYWVRIQGQVIHNNKG